MKIRKIKIWGEVVVTVIALVLTLTSFSNAAVNNEDTVGSLENADCSSISGWAYDPDTPKRGVTIQVLKDGSSVGEYQTADRDGGYRFNVSTPDTFKDGQSHQVGIKALNNRDGGGGNDTVIGTKTIQCGGSGGGGGGGGTVWPPPEGTPDSTIRVTADKYSCFDLLRQEDGRIWNNLCGSDWSGTRLSGTYQISAYLQGGVPPSSVTPASWTFVSPGSTLTFKISWTGSGAQATNNPPIGKLGLPDCNEIFGWAFDPDTSSNSITVELYREGQAGSGGIRVGSWPTDVFRGDVNSTYNITGNHGYQFATPESLKDGSTHSLYMYGIDTSGGRNALLDQSPQTLVCGGKNTGTVTIRSYDSTSQGIRATYVLTRPDGSSFTDSISGDFSFRDQPTGTWNVRGETLVNYKYPPLISPGNSQTLKKNDTITYNFTWEPQPQPPTAEITCNGSSSTTVPYGGSVEVRWSSTNANSCTVSPDGWTGRSGNKTVTNITSFKSYRVTCNQ